MYPMIYFQSFRQLVMGNEAFVAMPMGDPSFSQIWTEVYQSAIDSVGLVPFRVDIPQTGESILIEILRGLRRAKLVLADISPDHRSGEYPNANVMYELGIAHAMRLPETVIVVRRSGGSPPPFDIRHIRARDYNASDLAAARESIRCYLEGALALGRALKDELVENAWSAMDPVCRDIVAREWYVASGRAGRAAKEKGEEYYDPHPGLIEYPVKETRYMRWHGEQVLHGFGKLLESGIIEAVTDRWDIVGRDLPVPLYRLTVLGEAVADRFTSIS